MMRVRIREFGLHVLNWRLEAPDFSVLATGSHRQIPPNVDSLLPGFMRTFVGHRSDVRRCSGLGLAGVRSALGYLADQLDCRTAGNR